MCDQLPSKIENPSVSPLDESASNTSGHDLLTEAAEQVDKENALLTAIKGDTQGEYWISGNDVTLSNTLNVCGNTTCPSI
jgi:hypothetical protein